MASLFACDEGSELGAGALAMDYAYHACDRSLGADWPLPEWDQDAQDEGYCCSASTTSTSSDTDPLALPRSLPAHHDHDHDHGPSPDPDHELYPCEDFDDSEYETRKAMGRRRQRGKARLGNKGKSRHRPRRRHSGSTNHQRSEWVRSEARAQLQEHEHPQRTLEHSLALERGRPADAERPTSLTLPCSGGCKRVLSRECFSSRQWRRRVRKCLECSVASARAARKAMIVKRLKRQEEKLRKLAQHYAKLSSGFIHEFRAHFEGDIRSNFRWRNGPGVELEAAPVAPGVLARFLRCLGRYVGGSKGARAARRRSQGDPPEATFASPWDVVELVFHGSDLANHASICENGLRVPRNRSEVRNGSAHGTGIYVSTLSSTSHYYTRSGSSMFVCAAIRPMMKTFGAIYVSPKAEYVCPLLVATY